MDAEELMKMLEVSRAELAEEKRRALRAEMEVQRLSKENAELTSHDWKMGRQAEEMEEELTQTRRNKVIAEDMIARARRALKTGNAPERVLAELATILLENSA